MEIKRLTEKEFEATFSEKMNDVTNDVEIIVDIWEYIKMLDPSEYPYSINRPIKKVYRNSINTYDQIVLPTMRKNVYFVIILDIKKESIYGHYLLDLNKKYGITMDHYKNINLKPTFLERLTAMYSGQFETSRVKRGLWEVDCAYFPAENKKFGSIEITGDLNEWRDEEDYFIEDENGIYDDLDTCGFYFRVGGYEGTFILSPTGIFYYLDKIFSDQIVVYFSPLAKKRGLYELDDLKKKLAEGKLRKRKEYRFWSGNYPLP